MKYSTALNVVTIFVLLSLSSVASTEATVESRASFSHLWPVDDLTNSDYLSALRTRLLKSPYDCGRMLVVPGVLGAEVSVSVYANFERGTATGGYAVTLSRASKSIWNAFSENGKSVGEISIQVSSVPIDQGTALAIREVWRAMLLQVRKPEEEVSPPLDDQSVIFSLWRGQSGPIYGELPFIETQDTFELHLLGDLLVRYCETFPENRPPLAHKIQEDAKHLLERVKGNHAR